MAWLDDTWGWIEARPWGSIGEWVSGLGALGAVVGAFVLQSKNHRREDDRINKLEEAEKHRAHLVALKDAQRDVRFELQFGNAPGHSFLVDYVNGGPQPYYATSVRLLNDSFVQPLSESWYALQPGNNRMFPWQSIGDSVRPDNSWIEAEFEDAMGHTFSYLRFGRIVPTKIDE